MIDFRPEHFDALGEGVCVPDGDTLYITNGHWLLVVTGCEHHIPLEILRIIANAENGFVDWRILGAREIYAQEGKYLPCRGSHSLDTVLPRYGRYSTISPEGIRGLLEKNVEPLWGECYKLDQLFSAGKARTKYFREESEKRKFSTEPAAEHYTFSLDGRVLSIAADYFRSFYELGFDINCPVRSSGPPNVLGLYRRETVPDVFGYLCPTRSSGVEQAPDGRKILESADTVSWYSIDEGVNELCAPRSYVVGSGLSVWDLLNRGIPTLNLGLSILRWHGVSDEDIERAYREGRPSAMRVILQEKTRALDRALRDDDRWSGERVRSILEDIQEIEEETGPLVDRNLLATASARA